VLGLSPKDKVYYFFLQKNFLEVLNCRFKKENFILLQMIFSNLIIYSFFFLCFIFIYFFFQKNNFFSKTKKKPEDLNLKKNSF
jgi:hypothetical protein